MEEKNDGNHMDSNPTERFLEGCVRCCPHSSCNHQLKEYWFGRMGFIWMYVPGVCGALLKHSHVFSGEKKH